MSYPLYLLLCAFYVVGFGFLTAIFLDGMKALDEREKLWREIDQAQRELEEALRERP